MENFEMGSVLDWSFAIFSILRYRTDPMPVREMTYLFIITALPMMNSVGVEGTLWPQLLLANGAVMLILLVLEKGWGFHYESSKRIVYEKVELIRPDRRAELIADLETRTGLKIKRTEIGKVDFLRDIADITVYYDDSSRDNWLQSNIGGAELDDSDDV